MLIKTTDDTMQGGVVPAIQRISGNTAQMFIFSPRRIPVQKVRPLVMNFSNSFLNDLNRVCQNQGANMPKLGDLNPMHHGAIIPAHDGVELNTEKFQAYPTFILIVSSSGSGYRLPAIKVMYTGYVDQELVNPLSGSVNYYAKLYITTYSLLTNANNVLSTQADGIMITPNLGSDMKKQQSLFFNMPGDIATLPEISHGAFNENVATNISSISVDALNDSRMISTKSSIPTALVNGLVESAKSAYLSTQLQSDSDWKAASDWNQGWDKAADFHQTVKQNIMTSLPAPSLKPDITSLVSLNPSEIYTMSSLEAKVGGDISIINVKNPFELQFDNIDQGWDNKQTILSYTLSNIIEPIAIDNGLVEIAFEYHSHCPTGSIVIGKQPQWLPFKFIPATDMNEQTFNNCVHRFKQHMEEYAFKSLSTMLGGDDFVVWVDWVFGQDCKIKMKPRSDVRNFQDGMWSTPGFLASKTAPTFGNAGTVQFNSQQMSKFIDAVRV